MSGVLQNIRVGMRSLRRTPGFAFTAIVTLALGIGLATAVFTVADAMLLRKLPVRDQDRIVMLWGELPKHGFSNLPLSLDDAREFARRSRALERTAFFAYEGASSKPIREGDQISRLRRALVSGEFFDVLGVRPALGRTLRADDDVSGAAPVVVLSHAAWHRKFAGDSAVIGRQLLMHENSVSFTIVGVMPAGLDYPRGTDFWAPVIASTPPATLQYVGLDIVGRLAPGAAPADARLELTQFWRRPEATPFVRDAGGVVHTMPRLVLGDTRPAVIVFAAAAAILLLITCVNVANLLLVRGLSRMREIAVRAALGAERRHVVGQLLMENTLLAIVGGILGIAVAAAVVTMFVAYAPAGLPRLDEIRLNGTAVAAAVAITAVATLVFALAPAIMTSRVDVQQLLRSGTRQSGGPRSRLAAELLVVGQVALSVIVLSAAGLIAKSLINLERAELSFEPSQLLIGELAIRYDQLDDVAKQKAMLAELLPRLEGIPGVRAVSPVVALPFSATAWDGRPTAEGQSPEEASTNPMLNMEVVTPGYFPALGVALLRGRLFSDEDRAGMPPVVVISETAARRYWPNADPIGKRLYMGPDRRNPLTVVGIVPDTRYRDLRDARASIYFPLAQSFFPFSPTTLVIRTTLPPASLVPVIRRVIGETSPGVALASASPFASYLEEPLAQPRLNALLLALFAGAAVTLAAVGLFGVMATMVRQRRRELGVRMALGATASAVGRLVLTRGMALAGAGTALGIGGALVANRLLGTLLFEVTPTDALTLALVAVALLGVAALASVIPARSGTRIQPIEALRAE